MVPSVSPINPSPYAARWHSGQRVRVVDEHDKNMGDGNISYVYGIGTGRRVSVMMEFPEKILLDVSIKQLRKIY